MRAIDQLGMWWRIAYVVFLFGAAVGATIFPFTYGILARWWETPMGRYMMYKGAVLAMALDLICLRVFFPKMPAWISVLLLGMIFIMIWWYMILFIMTYLRGRRKRREDRRNH
jgi:hypothetical protein